MRTLCLGAVRIYMKRVIMHRKAVFGSDFCLARLNSGIVELLDVAALQANDVIMVLALIEFEYRLSTFEIMAHQQAGMLELG